MERLSIKKWLVHNTFILTPVHTSIALVYATGGRELLMEAVWVDIVSSVVTPKLTLAGTALGSNQKLTHDTITNMQQGT